MTVLALDIGGSTVRGALVRLDGTVQSRTTVSTGDRDPGLRAVRRIAERLVAEAADEGHQVRAIGAGVPEYVDADGRLTSTDVLDWDQQPADLLADLAPTVCVDSDVRCGALGELHAPGGRRRDFVYVSLGTGLSYALVHEGVARRGARGEAIALGELPVTAVVATDWAGSLEGFASGAGLAHRYAESTGAAVPDGARAVLALAAAGDAVARDVLTSAGLALGHALAQLVWLLDPGAVVLGGGLGSSEGLLHEELRSSYAALLTRRPRPPELVTGVLGAGAGLAGAAHLAWSAVSPGEELL